jgi:hypothetical protein
MKIHAARVERDADGILALCRVRAIGTWQEALDVAEEAYGPGMLAPRSHFLVQELLSGEL